MKYTTAILVCISAFALVLRVVWIDSIPSILNRDEAALAYNALLLEQTGRDEWQRPWPLALESFGDYKLPGYPILLSILFRFVGYSDVAVRLPSAVAGTLLVVLSFFFARSFRRSEPVSLLFSFLIAVTPVFWFYSRIAFEANVALSLVVALCIVIYSSKNKLRWSLRLFIAGLLMLAAVFTYNTPMVLLPSLLLPTALFSYTKLQKGSLWALGLILLLSSSFVLVPLTARKSGITVFSDETVWSKSIEFRSQLPDYLKSTLGNKYLFFAGMMAKNTVVSFSPQFLVTNGGSHPWHSLPNWGHLYWSIYLLASVGGIASATALLRKLKDPKAFKVQGLLLFLLLTSLLPSVVTVDSPHATRSLFFLYLIVFFAVLGFEYVISVARKVVRGISPQLLYLALVLVVASEATWYGYQLFFKYPDQQPELLKVGFDQVIREATQSHPTGDIAIVDDEGFHYILAAWYLRIAPQEYFETTVRQQPDKIGFRYGERVGRLHFIANKNDKSDQERVIVDWTGNRWHVLTY